MRIRENSGTATSFLWSAALTLLFALSFAISIPGAAANAALAGCPALNALANQSTDAGPVLQKCLDQIPAGYTLAVAPGSYQLATPIRVSHSLTIQTAGLPGGKPCWQPDDRRCAHFVANIQATAVGPAWQHGMPIEITGDNVTFDHLLISGVRGRNPANDRALCLAPKLKSMGGGLRVSGDHFELLNSALTTFTCYTAMEVTSKGAVAVKDDFVAANGNHLVHGMWSDGVTIHDAVGATVEDNIFVDNTDVQLIFGGCRNCLVSRNRFRHSKNPAGGAFAELMLQAWPRQTSGRYDGTVVSDNDIDCGPSKLCGFGLMIGGAPWYSVPTAGGTVTHNTVRNAMLGLNVDNLTGPMTITDNQVVNSGGRFEGTCGTRNLPAVNIAPPSRRFIGAPAIAGSPVAAAPPGEEFAGCIFNHPVNAAVRR
jgi:hypothetical protein